MKFWITGIILISATILHSKEVDEKYRCYARAMKDHVCPAGVDYKGLKSSGELEKCREEFSPTREEFAGMGEKEQIAFLINAYNYYTLRLVVENFPLISIRDLDKPWDRRFIPLFGSTVSLNQIEHDMLRKNFQEPRIHFAVNCASIGCPSLWETPFRSRDLDAQLEAAAMRFLKDSSKNRYDGKALHLSKIFEWYGEDFKPTHGSYRNYVQEKLGIEGKPKIKFLDYDWNLNQVESCSKP